ncbi:hypothetical protein CDD81_1913 [Ophiocordyceps australis]|uniref:Uncharacterized protein n=1 Tax=Ophiocordyceps australis TaxID=1399860 RepID=A0A2C5XZV7_9HYPO|nr:hypothetical protein CDD81_1913 [Ophiocordyceps australis]
MLDENLPTYRQLPWADDGFTLLSLTHKGSEATSEYLLERPPAAASPNQYVLGLLDAHHPSVVYAQVLVCPEWTQPSLSAAELRAGPAGQSEQLPMTPDVFTVSLYNPEQSVTVRKRQHRAWGKPDAWEFEVPQCSFRRPTASQVDRELDSAAVARGAALAADSLEPKLLFRWRRDGRLSKDMTCYMCGRSVGGRKSKEPDITVAMLRCGGNRASGQSSWRLTIYEPNMARVHVQDGKGLEIIFLLSAEAIRDLYLAPRHNVFNVSGGANKSEHRGQPDRGRREHTRTSEEQARISQEQARISQEQARIRSMLDREAAERAAAVERETLRLQREYGVASTRPDLPPRTTPRQDAKPKQWRASSLGPVHERDSPRKHPLGLLLQRGSAASAFFGRPSDGDARPKLDKKPSLYF